MTPITEKLLKQMDARYKALQAHLIEQLGNVGDHIRNPSDAKGLCINLFMLNPRPFDEETVIILLKEFLNVPYPQLLQLRTEFMRGQL